MAIGSGSWTEAQRQPPDPDPRAPSPSHRVLLERLLAWDRGRAAPAGVPDSADWERIVPAARAHGLCGLLPSAAPPEVMASLSAPLQRELAVQRVLARSARAALIEVLQLLEQAGIGCAPLKGPWLAHRLYPDPELRASGDLDLLVAEAKVDAAAAALTRAGFAPEPSPSGAWYRRHHHHISLQRPGSPPVELHFRATSGFGVIQPSEPLLARSVPSPAAAGVQIRTLSLEDEFLYLCLHAAGHRFERIGWLCDLALFLERFGRALDWPTVEARAAALPARGALRLTLFHLRLLGCQVPAEPSPLSLSLRVAERVRPRALGRGQPHWQRTCASLAFHALTCDRWWLAARWAFHRLRLASDNHLRRAFPSRAREPRG